MDTSRESLPHGVILAATPLGNPDDASDRLKCALASAPVIASEDTRRTRALAQALGVEITGKVISNFDHNEGARVEQLLELARHSSVLVVTDAGMPIVSDPGLPLVAAAHDAGIPVTCIPGPSAVTTALALSGLGVGKFIFDGFAPRKGGQRRTWLESLRSEQRAVCFFESPYRIADTLATAAEVLGSERRAAVARELTKTFEEVRRGTLAELAQWSEQGVRGEITVVIEGVQQRSASPEDLLGQVANLVNAGIRLKDAAGQVAQTNGASKKQLYDAFLSRKAEESVGE